jgi:membrane-associated phospholipid phosphatase
MMTAALVLAITSSASAGGVRIDTERIGLTAGLLATAPAFYLLVPEPPSGWQDSILFDRPARDLLRLRAPDDRKAAAIASDVIQNVLVLYPFVIDAGLVGLAIDRDPDLALDLALESLEAFALELALVFATKRIVGRVRPAVEPCPDTGGYACRSNAARRSFLSGHTTASFTGAGLLCAQHRRPLYGGGLPDALACAAGLVLATVAGALRVASDEHHATDVVVSAGVGLLSGYVFPTLAHPRASGATDAVRLDGSARLTALAGGGSTGGARAFAAGMGIDLGQMWWWDRGRTAGVELGGSALFARSVADSSFREGRARVRAAWSALRLGAELAYRAEEDRAGTRTGVLLGPSLAIGSFEEETSIVASIAWLPILDGRSDHVEASLEISFLRYATASIELRRSLDRGGLALVAIGGRLPW